MADRQRRWLPGADRGPLHRERPPIRTTFRYDEQGRLAERTERPDLDKPTSKRRTFLYDQAGNLLETDLWHDDRQVSHEEFLYEADTFFLKARIRKDLGTGTIHVVRFTTERR